jgi:glycosyltransferase involved in cell wall biosynthesis
MSFYDLHLGPATVSVSVVVPVRNEVGSVAALAGEVTAAMGAVRGPWECVWVDDGSTDQTLAEVMRVCESDPRHRFVELDRGYGQSAALGAGFTHSRGAIIAMIDGDGQNDPADLPRLLAVLADQKLDAVNSYRERSQFGWTRRLSSRIANGFRNRLTGESVRDVGCSVRVMRRPCLEGIPVFKGMHRFLPTLIRLNGYDRIAEIPVRHRPRHSGESKYGISNRLWVGIEDTLAVRWMSHRMVAPRVKRASLDGRKEAYL